MEIETTTGKTVEIETPATEWTQLSADPLNHDGLAVYDAGKWLLLVRMNPVLGPTEVVDAGRELRALADYDRDAIDASLATEFEGVISTEDRTAILDRYEEVVAEICELELYDTNWETTFVESLAYLRAMDKDEWTDEILTVLGNWDETVASDIAAQVDEWWTPQTDDEKKLSEEHVYAAHVDFVGN